MIRTYVLLMMYILRTSYSIMWSGAAVCCCVLRARLRQ